MGEIAKGVRDCLREFSSLRESFGHLEEESRVLFLIENAQSRFKIWSSNLAAHARSGRRSLDYRLRDSEDLKATVLELLDGLLRSLRNVSNSGDEDSPVSGNNDEGSDLSGGDDESLDLPSGESQSRLEKTLKGVNDLVNLFYRFSSTLRKPAGSTRIKDGISSISDHSYRYDAQHLQEKFPTLEIHLVERLGRATSERRQYFRYREEHHAKLAAGLDDSNQAEEDPTEGNQSTIATSVPSNIEQVTIVDDTESLASVNSFAPTESDSGTLKPPPLPERGQNGEPFECHICFDIISCGEHAWRQHVFEDLTPYQCTQVDCTMAKAQYAHRREWRSHELNMHCSVWDCPFECDATHDSATAFERHLVVSHRQTAGSSFIRAVLRTCARPLLDKLRLTCPFCKKEAQGEKLWFKHVGKHFEQLALFSLPSHVLGDVSDVETEADEVSGLVQVNDDERDKDLDFLTSVGHNERQDVESASKGLQDDDDDDEFSEHNRADTVTTSVHKGTPYEKSPNLHYIDEEAQILDDSELSANIYPPEKDKTEDEVFHESLDPPSRTRNRDPGLHALSLTATPHIDDAREEDIEMTQPPGHPAADASTALLRRQSRTESSILEDHFEGLTSTEDSQVDPTYSEAQSAFLISRAGAILKAFNSPTHSDATEAFSHVLPDCTIDIPSVSGRMPFAEFLPLMSEHTKSSVRKMEVRNSSAKVVKDKLATVFLFTSIQPDNVLVNDSMHLSRWRKVENEWKCWSWTAFRSAEGI